MMDNVDRLLQQYVRSESPTLSPIFVPSDVSFDVPSAAPTPFYYPYFQNRNTIPSSFNFNDDTSFDPSNDDDEEPSKIVYFFPVIVIILIVLIFSGQKQRTATNLARPQQNNSTLTI